MIWWNWKIMDSIANREVASGAVVTEAEAHAEIEDYLMTVNDRSPFVESVWSSSDEQHPHKPCPSCGYDKPMCRQDDRGAIKAGCPACSMYVAAHTEDAAWHNWDRRA